MPWQIFIEGIFLEVKIITLQCESLIIYKTMNEKYQNFTQFKCKYQNMINVNKTLTYTHVFRVCAKRMPYEPSQDEKFVYKQNVF